MFEDDLIELVSDGTATSEDGEHLLLVHSYHPRFIRMDGQLRSIQQASGYLATGEWGSVVPTCGAPECIHPAHMEAAELVMVAQANVASLADLYRKAKSRGLITPQTEYAG